MSDNREQALSNAQKAQVFGGFLGEILASIAPMLKREDLEDFFNVAHAKKHQELYELRDFVCSETVALCQSILEDMKGG